MRRSARCAVANMERGRRSRRSPSACPRQGARALRFARQANAKPRRAPAAAPNTPTRRAKASASPGDGRASRALCRVSSSVNRAAWLRAHRSRGKRAARLRVARLRPGLPRRGKRRRQRALRGALRQRRKRLGPGRVADVDAPRCQVAAAK